jgi:hypothetical protein
MDIKIEIICIWEDCCAEKKKKMLFLSVRTNTKKDIEECVSGY